MRRRSCVVAAVAQHHTLHRREIYEETFENKKENAQEKENHKNNKTQCKPDCPAALRAPTSATTSVGDDEAAAIAANSLHHDNDYENFVT
jgi:hypothetical protein